MNLIRVNAEDRFLGKLKGVTEPEAKRKIIGEEFIRVFEEESNKLGKMDFLVQGTIYPDIVESGLGGESATIKSHHNVGGLPEDVDFQIVEPLKELFKDEVRKIGGNGVCGRELCCCSFLNNFDMVSIKMAKEQSASLNPSKISGNCGRLMCCLKYEQEVYEDKIKKLPKVGSIVKTEDGEGTVVTQEVLKEAIKVQFRKDDITTYKTYPAKDVKVIKNASGNDKNSIDNTVDSEEMANLKELQKLEELEKRDKIIEKEENKKRNN